MPRTLTLGGTEGETRQTHIAYNQSMVIVTIECSHYVLRNTCLHLDLTELITSQIK